MASGRPASEWPDGSIGVITDTEDNSNSLAQLPTNESATIHWNKIIDKTDSNLVDGVHYWRANKRIEEFRDRKFLHK